MAIKTLKEEVSLHGKLETITSTELRQQPGEVLTSVGLGKTFVVTKNGKPVAVISRPPGETLTIEIHPDGKTSFSK